jgi:SnoaL-like domain
MSRAPDASNPTAPGTRGFQFADPVEAMVARAEIEQLLTRRGRAADAKNPDAIVVEHVPGSRDVHGIFDGTIEQFAEYLRTHNYRDERYGLQRHTISNVLIDFTSSTTAEAESYHLAYHRICLPSGAFDVHIGGRYLDRCQLSGGRWLLASRSVIYDWSRSNSVSQTTITEDT